MVIDFNRLPPITRDIYNIDELKQKVIDTFDEFSIPLVLLCFAEGLIDDCHIQLSECGEYNKRQEDLAKKLAELAYEYAEGVRNSN